MALFAGLGAIFASVKTWFTGLSALAQFGVRAAASLALNAAATALMGRPKRPESSITVSQPDAPRRRGYGRAMLAGVRADFDVAGRDLVQAVMLHQGEVDAWEDLYLSDREVTVDGGGVVDGGDSDGFVTLETHVGTDAQTASPLLLSKLAHWTADHRLRGIAYIAAAFRRPPLKKFQTVYPEGDRTAVRAVARLSKVRDPASLATARAWSDNPARCIADWLTHPDGYGLADDLIDWPAMTAAATHCAQAVTLAAGGTQPRYALGGVYELTDEPTAVLAGMLAACDGEVYTTPAGKQGLRVGVWTEPTAVYGAGDVLSHSLTRGPDPMRRYNRLKVLYLSPRHDWQMVEAEPWEDAADIATNGVIVETLELPWVQDWRQARRLGKIRWHRDHPAWRGTIRLKPGPGLRAWGERRIRVQLPAGELGAGAFDVVFETDGGARAELAGGTIAAIEVSVRSTGAAAYAWTTAEEGAEPPLPPGRADPDMPTPAGIVLSVQSRPAAGSAVPVIVATATAEDDLTLEGRLREDGSSDAWEAMRSPDEGAEAVSGPVADGTTYEVELRWVGARAGAWTAAGTILAVADSAAPAAVTGLTGGESDGEVLLAWIAPPTHFAAARVYRGATATFGDATVQADVYGWPGSAGGYEDEPGAGTWRYWVTARNASGVESAPAGPVTITI